MTDDDKFMKAIHYPECWDTAAYPTLASALWELVCWYTENICPTCNKKQEIKDYTMMRNIDNG